jgi:Fic family protein
MLRVLDLLAKGVGVDTNGRYAHWDTLRHQQPPEGASSVEWWVTTKLARRQAKRELPMLSVEGSTMFLVTTNAMAEYLHDIDLRAGGMLFGPEEVRDDALRRRYQFLMLTEEAITSSQLEGATTTREVAREMIRAGRTPMNKPERMILNNYRSMEFVQSIANDNLTIDTVLELHRVVSEGTLDNSSDEGRVRQSNDIVIEDTTGARLFTPPVANIVPDELTKLVEFANSKPQPFLHPVVHAILLHFWLAYLHPFVDGNGRTARLLFYWKMLRSGYWLAPYISISNILRTAPSKYARAFLYVETDEHDVTYFVLNQLRVIQRAIDHTVSYVRKKATEQANLDELLHRLPELGLALNHRQKALLAHAVKHPRQMYTIRSHMVSHGISYLTARADLWALARLNLLDSQQSGRSLHFFAPNNVLARLQR